MKKIVLTILLLSSLVNAKAQSWSPVGPGVGAGSYSFVSSFATYNGELYLGGYFNSAGNIVANSIARWNGTDFLPVGNGVNGSVRSLCVFDDELYVGGNFTAVGNITANSIAKWNGANWSAVGSVEAYNVNSMAVFNGELYAAGWFPEFYSYGTPIVKWNGTNWQAILPDNDFYSLSIECMAVYDGSLYVAGAYYLIGGGGVAEYYKITRWDGATWSDLLTIPASYTLDGALGDIFSMVVYNGELYVAGGFGMMIDSISTSQIVRWNGSSWSTVGSGINFESFPYGGDSDGSSYTAVRTLAVCNGALYAGGRFNNAGSVLTRNVGKWDGNAWSGLDLGTNANVYALIGFDSSVFVGGSFTAVNGNKIPAKKIASWSVPCSTVPVQPLMIHGNDTVCRQSTQTYYVNETPGTTNYTWSLPPGWTGHSTTNSITVISGDNEGTISVTANNFCGNSAAQSLHVMALAGNMPAIQTAINGNETPCLGSTQTYSINAVSNATGYTWTLPTGWTGSSIDTSITVLTSQSDGFVAVRANNDCGSSLPKLLPVTVAQSPQKPDLIIGRETVCIGAANLYYVAPFQQATNYSWELPQGWTGNSITDSIMVIAGNNNGVISVRAYNDCGISDHTTLPVAVDPIPRAAGDIFGNNYTNTHSINYYYLDPVPGIISYTWNASPAIIQGQNTNSISAIWKYPGVYEISVYGTNKCGTTALKKITVNVTDFDDNDPFNLQVFPNPSNGAFSIKAKRIQNKMITIEILSVTGQVIYRSSGKVGSNDHMEFIDLKNLSKGIYVCKILIGDKVYSKKIVIQ